MRPRRLVPSISLLSAFEAVLRTGSTAAAARELDLTQSTVSRLVKTLEAQLGRPLFQRHKQRLEPTAAALAYGRDITRALDLVQRASMEFTANPGGGALSLAILPAFGTRWLAPRLPDFLSAHPGVTISLATRLKRFNFAAESFDAAIHFGAADWHDADHMKLFEERLTACASPAFIARHGPVGPAAMATLPLLQLETRQEAWKTWYEAQGLEAPRVGGMLFDQFATMTQAAIAGLGVALLPDYLADAEIEDGRLSPVMRRSLAGSGAYWLAWPKARASYPPLEAFRDWLAREIARRDARSLRAFASRVPELGHDVDSPADEVLERDPGAYRPHRRRDIEATVRHLAARDALDRPGRGRGTRTPTRPSSLERRRNMADPFDLERFRRAQAPVFNDVVAELMAGRKTGHWMWFVFPQLDGLGSSPTAKTYAIGSLDEARAYLEDPELGARLIQCVDLVNQVRDRSANAIFGSPDDLKLRSCLTLFGQAAPDQIAFETALKKYYGGEADARTLALLQR